MDATEISVPMIAEDILAKEFTRVLNHYYPKVGELLDGCYVKVITCFWGRPARRLQYIGIYCSAEMISYVQAHKEILREVADNMGLVQVVCTQRSSRQHGSSAGSLHECQAIVA